MGSRDRLRDFRQGRVTRSAIFEAVLRHRDGVRAAVPFTDQPSARLQSEARIWTDTSRSLEHLRQCLELAADRLAEPTILNLLQAVVDSTDEQIATESRRLAAVEPPPFAADVINSNPVWILHCQRNLLIRRTESRATVWPSPPHTLPLPEKSSRMSLPLGEIGLPRTKRLSPYTLSHRVELDFFDLSFQVGDVLEASPSSEGQLKQGMRGDRYMMERYAHGPVAHRLSCARSAEAVSAERANEHCQTKRMQAG